MPQVRLQFHRRTYGEPDSCRSTKTCRRAGQPYGASKLFSERMLRDLARTLPDLSYALLRYFNVAGAAADGTLGEHHDPKPISSP